MHCPRTRALKVVVGAVTPAHANLNGLHSREVTHSINSYRYGILILASGTC